MPLNISRLQKLRTLLVASKIDIYIICNPLDLRYFLAQEIEGILVVIQDKSYVYLITDGRYQQLLQSENKRIKIMIARKGYVNELKKLLARYQGRKKIVLEGTTNLETYLKLKNEFRNLSSDFLVRELRKIKDRNEIARIKKAIEITKEAISNVRNKLRNRREKEIKAYLEFQMQSLGAEGSAFAPIVASGANSAYPHASPTERKISRFLLLDCGARYRGYCADLTRMFFWDKIPKVIRRAYEVITEAKQLSISLIKEGEIISNLVTRVENYIKKKGFSENISHGLGHGLGLEIHEPPFVNRYNQEPLKSGMVITIEPGLYFPGVGGVRWEDVVLVEKNRGVIL